MITPKLLLLNQFLKFVFSNKWILILICSPLISTAQNLVSNPSFEEMLWENPPFVGGFQSAVIDWDGYLTSDIHYDGKGSTSMDFPKYGYQQPFDGGAMAGIRAFDFLEWEWHEIIYTQLLDTLIAGELYFVSFWVSPSEGVRYATDDIGIYFSADLPYEDRGKLFNIKPQISNPEGNYIDDTTIWHEISGYYKAKGGEQTLYLGNFKTDNQTTYQQINMGQGISDGAYFFVDQVLVEKCPTPICIDLRDTTLCGGETIKLNVETAEATYLWEDNSTSAERTISNHGHYQVQVSTGGCTIIDSMTLTRIPATNLGADTLLCTNQTIQLSATPIDANYSWSDHSTDSTLLVTSAGNYTIQVEKGICSFQDTIQVSYIDDSIGLSPNPNNGNFSISNPPQAIDKIVIYDSAGKLVFEVEVNNIMLQLNLKNQLADGVYFVHVTTGACTNVKKMVVVEY